MKRSLLFFSLVLLFLASSFYRAFSLEDFSFRFFQHLFSSPQAREVFCLEEDEAREVFGDLGEEVFL